MSKRSKADEAGEADAGVGLSSAFGCRLTVLRAIGDTSHRAEPLARLGAPGRTRTCDPLLRRQPLCPLSYGRATRFTVPSKIWVSTMGVKAITRDPAAPTPLIEL